MTTRREQVLSAMQETILLALAPLTASVIVKDRNTPLAERIDVLTTDQGKAVVVLTDGDAAPPTPLLGCGTIYDHTQTATLEAIVVHADGPERDAALDRIFSAVADAILCDPTLGGVCDYCGLNPPTVSLLDDDGVPGGKAAELPIDLLFSSQSPLG